MSAHQLADRPAAALLRWIYSLVVHGTGRDPAAAGRGLTEAA